MPFVQPLSIEDAPQDSQPILKAIKEKLGAELNIFHTMAHQPDILGGVAKINDGIENDLPAKLRELAYYKASQVNSCDYCSHYHGGAAKKAGVSDQQLEAIDSYESSDLFDEQEKAVLAYSEQLTQSAKVDSKTVDAVKKFLDDKHLVSLAGTVALANFTNRFNHGLDIQLP